MTLVNKIKTLIEERDQRDKAIEARAKLQNFARTTKEIDRILQDISNSGCFDSVDNEIKQSLLAGWDIIKGAKTALENSAIVDLLGE